MAAACFSILAVAAPSNTTPAAMRHAHTSSRSPDADTPGEPNEIHFQVAELCGRWRPAGPRCSTPSDVSTSPLEAGEAPVRSIDVAPSAEMLAALDETLFPSCRAEPEPKRSSCPSPCELEQQRSVSQVEVFAWVAREKRCARKQTIVLIFVVRSMRRTHACNRILRHLAAVKQTKVCAYIEEGVNLLGS